MVSSVKQKIEPSRVITNLMRGQWAASIVRAALELKVFDAVVDGGKTAEQIATHCKTETRPMMLLLNSLVGLELLRQSGPDKYELTSESEHYLVTTSPLYLGRYLSMQPRIAESWAHLSEIVKTGEPFAQINKDEKAAEFFPELAAALFAMNLAYARDLCDQLTSKSSTGDLKILDLACGSGVWSIPLAMHSKNTRVDALDFPSVLETTKEFTKKNGVADQYEYLAGNWRQVKLKEVHYDVIILGHILHSEGMEHSKQMIDAAYSALKKGGKIVIAEMLTDESRCTPPFASMFAINMLVMTSEGCVFSLAELSKMLTDAGFKGVETLLEDPQSATVVLAQK